MNTAFLDIFNLPPKSKLVLLDIVKHGTSSVAVISKRLNMPKSSVYDAIVPLLYQSLINEYSENQSKTFGISEKDQLARAYNKKIEDLKDAHSSMLSFLKNHKTEDSVSKPTIKFYIGDQGIKQAFRDMPWTKEIKEGYLAWPLNDMIESVGEEFLQWHGKERIKQGVILNSIQRQTDRKLKTNTPNWWKDDFKNNLRRVRYLPKGMDWKMSIWIYGNKCLFASGGSEKIAFTVHSNEFAELMKLMWQGLWEKAKG